MSLNSLACPNLAGQYFCEMGQAQVVKLDISKNIDGGITTYTFKENQDERVSWIADQREHLLPASSMDGITNLKYIASCHKKILTLKMSGDIPEFNQRIQMTTDIWSGQSGELIQRTKGHFSDGTPIPEARISCLKVNAAASK